MRRQRYAQALVLWQCWQFSARSSMATATAPSSFKQAPGRCLLSSGMGKVSRGQGTSSPSLLLGTSPWPTFFVMPYGFINVTMPPSHLHAIIDNREGVTQSSPWPFSLALLLGPFHIQPPSRKRAAHVAPERLAPATCHGIPDRLSDRLKFFASDRRIFNFLASQPGTTAWHSQVWPHSLAPAWQRRPHRPP